MGVLNHPLFTCEESQISISVTKYPQKSNLKEESFILAPGFRDFCPCLLGAFVLGTVLKQQNVTTEEMVEYSSSSPPKKNEGERRGEETGRGREREGEREFECSWARFLIYSSHAPMIHFPSQAPPPRVLAFSPKHHHLGPSLRKTFSIQTVAVRPRKKPFPFNCDAEARTPPFCGMSHLVSICSSGVQAQVQKRACFPCLLLPHTSLTARNEKSSQ